MAAQSQHRVVVIACSAPERRIDLAHLEHELRLMRVLRYWRLQQHAVVPHVLVLSVLWVYLLIVLIKSSQVVTVIHALLHG